MCTRDARGDAPSVRQVFHLLYLKWKRQKG